MYYRKLVRQVGYLPEFHTEVVEKVSTHILCPVFPAENRAVYEITWTGMAEPGRPQMTI